MLRWSVMLPAAAAKHWIYVGVKEGMHLTQPNFRSNPTSHLTLYSLKLIPTDLLHIVQLLHIRRIIFRVPLSRLESSLLTHGKYWICSHNISLNMISHQLLKSELIDLSRKDTKNVYVQSTIRICVCSAWHATHNPGPYTYPHTTLHSHTRLQTMLGLQKMLRPQTMLRLQMIQRLQTMLRLTCNTPPTCYAPLSKKTSLDSHCSLLKTLSEQGKCTTVAWGWPSINTKKSVFPKRKMKTTLN
jgi:hypothetical protein